MAELSPDDLCGVCGTIRELHGDKNHKFDLDGNLIPVKEPVNKMPAAPRVIKDPVPATMLRLVERLVAKKLLDGDDLLFILGGVENGETNRGSVGPFATGANHSPST